MRFGTVAILNPASGKGMTRQSLARLIRWLKDILFLSEDNIFLTEKDGERTALSLASSAQKSGARKIVVCGGDGTLHKVVNGLSLPDPRLSVGIVPCGTSNMVASCLGMPRDPKACLEIIRDDRTRYMDLGELEGDGLPRYAVFTASVGFDAMINELAHRVKPKLRRHHLPTILGYVPPLLRYVFCPAPTYPIVIQRDGSEVSERVSFLTVSNTPRYGGGIVDQSAKMDDGFFSLLYAREMGALDLPKRMLQMWRGSQVRCPRVFSACLPFSNLKIASEISMPFQVDGEVVSPQKQISISVLPKALRVISPMPELAEARSHLTRHFRLAPIGGIGSGS